MTHKRVDPKFFVKTLLCCQKTLNLLTQCTFSQEMAKETPPSVCCLLSDQGEWCEGVRGAERGPRNTAKTRISQ